MKYGYCRISTNKQNIERQERNIKAAAPDCIIVKEVFTGTRMDSRPKWHSLYNSVKDGDVIYFDSVSRMSRNAEEGFEAYENLFKRGVSLVFLKEPHINTDTYKKAAEGRIEASINSGDDNADKLISGIVGALNEYMMGLAREQIRIAFNESENEVKTMKQRTIEGLVTARLNGKQLGRPKCGKFETKKSKEAKKDIIKFSRSFNGSLTDDEVMKLIGISRNSFYKYKAELKNDISASPIN